MTKTLDYVITNPAVILLVGGLALVAYSFFLALVVCG